MLLFVWSSNHVWFFIQFPIFMSLPIICTIISWSVQLECFSYPHFPVSFVNHCAIILFNSDRFHSGRSRDEIFFQIYSLEYNIIFNIKINEIIFCNIEEFTLVLNIERSRNVDNIFYKESDYLNFVNWFINKWIYTSDYRKCQSNS